MINPVTGWFKITQYYDKREISIANLVETTWMSRYPIPIEIMYDQGSEFIGHEFRKSIIANNMVLNPNQDRQVIHLLMKYWR